MKRFQRPAVMLAAGALTIGGLAACGDKKNDTSSKDPKVALAAAFTTFGDSKNFAVTLHFKDDKGSLAKSFKAEAEDDAEKAIIDRVLSGSIKISSSDRGNNKHDFKIELLEGSTADFSFSVVNEDLYVHLDKGFLTEVGGQDAIDAISGIAPALATGGTIKISGLLKTFEGLSELSGGGSAKPTPSIDPKAISDSFSKAINSAVTITKQSGDTYAISADVKALANVYLDVFKPLLSAIPEAASELGDFSDIESQISSIPAGSVSGTVTVKSGAVKELGLDLESIVKYIVTADPSSAEGAPDVTGAQLVATFDASAPAISAPSGATSFDISKLIQQFMGGALGSALSGGGSGGTPTIPCSALPAGITIPCSK